jgi:hypothetical protein
MNLNSKAYVEEPSDLIAFYKKQAETGKDTYPRYHHSYQRGGGLGNAFGSLHSVAIPIPVSSKKKIPTKLITPKVQSPSQGAVDRAKETLKREYKTDSTVNVVSIPMKKCKKKKQVN